jgi:hypothetical protein
MKKENRQHKENCAVFWLKYKKSMAIPFCVIGKRFPVCVDMVALMCPDLLGKPSHM